MDAQERFSAGSFVLTAAARRRGSWHPRSRRPRKYAIHNLFFCRWTHLAYFILPKSQKGHLSDYWFPTILTRRIHISNRIIPYRTSISLQIYREGTKIISESWSSHWMMSLSRMFSSIINGSERNSLLRLMPIGIGGKAIRSHQQSAAWTTHVDIIFTDHRLRAITWEWSGKLGIWALLVKRCIVGRFQSTFIRKNVSIDIDAYLYKRGKV